MSLFDPNDETPLEVAARKAVTQCMGVNEGEQVLIVGDRSTDTICEAIAKAVKARNAELELIWLEKIAHRPLTSFPKEVGDALKKADVSFLAVMAMGDELPSFRKPYIGEIIKRRIRHAHMPTVTEHVFLAGMQADYDQVNHLTKGVHDAVKGMQTIHIETPAGTNLTANLNPKWKWKLCGGVYHKRGDWGNLPDGEVFTCPADVNGVMAVDGCLGDTFDVEYGELGRQDMLRIPIESGYAQIDKIRCNKRKLLNEFKKYLSYDVKKFTNRVGELGFGTNYALKSLIGNMLVDEKYPGAHIAFGDTYHEETGADWESPKHIDGVMKTCTIKVFKRSLSHEKAQKETPDRVLMSRGQYRI